MELGRRALERSSRRRRVHGCLSGGDGWTDASQAASAVAGPGRGPAAEWARERALTLSRVGRHGRHRPRAARGATVALPRSRPMPRRAPMRACMPRAAAGPPSGGPPAPSGGAGKRVKKLLGASKEEGGWSGRGCPHGDAPSTV